MIRSLLRDYINWLYQPRSLKRHFATGVLGVLMNWFYQFYFLEPIFISHQLSKYEEKVIRTPVFMFFILFAAALINWTADKYSRNRDAR